MPNVRNGEGDSPDAPEPESSTIPPSIPAEEPAQASGKDSPVRKSSDESEVRIEFKSLQFEGMRITIPRKMIPVHVLVPQEVSELIIALLLGRRSARPDP